MAHTTLENAQQATVSDTATPAARASLDTELLAACERLQALEKEILQLHPISDVLPATPAAVDADEKMDELRDEQEEIGEAIAAMPARTPAGLRAKAAALVTFWGGPEGRCPIDLAHLSERMDWSVILDAAGRPIDADNPDAELIRVCAQHVESIRAYIDPSWDGEDDHPVSQAYGDSLDAMCDLAEPQTLAGVLAFARAAKAAANARNDGIEDWEGTMGETWAPKILNALLRLHGEA